MKSEKAVQLAVSLVAVLIMIITVNASAPEITLESTATVLKQCMTQAPSPALVKLAEAPEVATEAILAQSFTIPVEEQSISADEYLLSAAEFDLITRVVISESGDEPFEGQCAVAQVIRDRLEHDNGNLYGGSVKGVLYKENQFASPYRGDLSKYPDAEKAVAAVFKEGYRVFDKITVIFFNPAFSDSSAMRTLRKYNYVGTVGDHEFYGDEKYED